MTRRAPVERIVSGGQTGADRAALDVARELGIAAGGWVPRGRRAEDGTVPARYEGLIETESDDYACRTRRNVRDSDATLVLAFGTPTGGTALAAREAHDLGRTLLTLDLATGAFSDATVRVRAWLAQTRPRALHVAGPRASEEPRIAEAVALLLRASLAGDGDAP